MNKRIEELARGCFEYIEGTPNGNIVEFDYKKFAELILQECSLIAEDCYVYHEPLSKVPTHIERFERLTDSNMSHKL